MKKKTGITSGKGRSCAQVEVEVNDKIIEVVSFSSVLEVFAVGKEVF